MQEKQLPRPGYSSIDNKINFLQNCVSCKDPARGTTCKEMRKKQRPREQFRACWDLCSRDQKKHGAKTRHRRRKRCSPETVAACLKFSKRPPRGSTRLRGQMRQWLKYFGRNIWRGKGTTQQIWFVVSGPRLLTVIDGKLNSKLYQEIFTGECEGSDPSFEAK